MKKVENENKQPTNLKVKLFAAFVWLCLISVFVGWYLSTGLTIREFINLLTDYITNFVETFGIWGGILYILIYTIRPLIFFPATILTALSGVLFGPILGILYTFIGENLSANLAFSVSRFFRKEGAYQAKWIAKIDEEASKNGLVTTLILRLIWAPFDAVNYGLGLTRVKHWEYALATAIGIIPGLTIFVLLGDAIKEGLSPQAVGINIVIAVVLFIFTLVLAKYLKKKYKHLDVIDEK